MHVDEATQTLTGAGFLVGVTDVPGDADAGTVVAQNPAEGGEVVLGSTIQLSVSDGLGILQEPEPPPDDPPDVPLPPDIDDQIPDDWPFPFPDSRPGTGDGPNQDPPRG
jgi:beta-lactam-binding protein with PASTA domain